MSNVEVSIKNISINEENADWWLSELVNGQFKSYFNDWKERNENKELDIDSICDFFTAGFFTGLSYGLEAQNTPDGMVLVE